MRVNLLLFVCSWLLYLPVVLANQPPKLISVKPDTLKMRHAQTIHFKLSNQKADTQLSISPGGAYVRNRLKGNFNALFLTNQRLMGLGQNNQIHLYQSNKTGFTPLNTISLNKNTRNISYSNQILVSATTKKLSVHQLNDKQEIVSSISNQLNHNIEKIAHSQDSVCLLLNNNQLIQFTISTGQKIESKKLANPIQRLGIFQNKCITTTIHHTLTLWKQQNNELIEHSNYHSSSEIHQIAEHQDKIILAHDEIGFSILDLIDDRLTWLSSYNKLGKITHIAAWKNSLLVADTRGILSLFDISQSDSPLLISDFNTHEKLVDLKFDGNFAYALSSDQLMQIDFSTRSTPTISTLGVNQGGSRRSFIKDNILYVADWFSGMHLYDISKPEAIKLISSYPTPGSPKGVVVRNNIAFIADDDHGLQIADVSNPTRPKFISELPLSGLAYTMKLEDNLLFIASHRGGFHIVDVSNEKKPRLLSSFDTPGKSWALAIQSQFLFVADDDSGVLIFDIKNPAQPILVNQFNPGGFAEDIFLKDGKAYIAFFDLGLFIVDTTDPLNLVEIAKLTTPGNARGLEIVGNTLYLASWEAGIHIIDITDNSNPTLLGHYDTKGATWGLSVNNEVLYAMDWWGGVKVINVSNSKRPDLLAKYQTDGKINDIIFKNGFIYTAHGSRGLQIYDANNSLNPVWATGLDISGDSRSISLNKQQALIAAGDAGLVIVDIKNPFQVKQLSQVKTTFSTDYVQSLNSLAFVASHGGDLLIFDISQPEQPLQLQQLKAETLAIKTSKHALFLLEPNGILRKINVNKLSNTTVEQRYKIDITARHLAIKNQSVFLGTEKGKITRYNMLQNSLQSTTSYAINEMINDMHTHKNSLYITSKNNKLFVFDIEMNNKMHLQNIYPTTHEITRISVSNDGIFLAGESTIASGKLLPDINITAISDGFIAEIPKYMPLGAYNVNVSNRSGKQNTNINAFQITFPKYKSKFTMEDLKKKMQEKSFSGKAQSSQ